MDIITKSVHLVNRDDNRVELKDISHSDFDIYILKLVDFIFENNKVREYAIRSYGTEIIRSVIDITTYILNDDYNGVANCCENIALRLLRTEIDIQDQIEHLGKEVQRGSLVQSFIRNPSTGNMYFLITKVEHSAWRDESDFIKKIGFPEENKNIWKSTIIEIIESEDSELSISNIFCYVNNNATYWSDLYLELDQLIDDGLNTHRAYNAIHNHLRNKLNKIAKSDYSQLRNDLIGEFRREHVFNYNEVIHSLFDGYKPENLTLDELANLENGLLELPEKTTKPFDKQFTIVPSKVTARMRKRTVDVAQGVQLNILGQVNEFRDTIFSTEKDGAQYVVVKTDSDSAFKSFPKKDF